MKQQDVFSLLLRRKREVLVNEFRHYSHTKLKYTRLIHFVLFNDDKYDYKTIAESFQSHDKVEPGLFYKQVLGDLDETDLLLKWHYRGSFEDQNN